MFVPLTNGPVLFVSGDDQRCLVAETPDANSQLDGYRRYLAGRICHGIDSLREECLSALHVM